MFRPIDRMWERVDSAREASDTELFLYLLYAGEMLTKTVTAGLLAAVMDERERLRYRQAYRLVRADGLGDWSSVLDDILTGPAAQHLMPVAREEQRELTQRLSSGTWQYEAVVMLHACLRQVDQDIEAAPVKLDLRRWFDYFVRLRNKTRGHGAIPASLYTSLCPDLEQSLRTIAENFVLLKRPWAYLHRNLSGKYRVTKLSDLSDEFDQFKSTATYSVTDGLYVHFGQAARVELVDSTFDALDFFFPNGSFNGKSYEEISYITGERRERTADAYLTPASELPPSETQSLGTLEPQGQAFTNLPQPRSGYVERPQLVAHHGQSDG